MLVVVVGILGACSDPQPEALPLSEDAGTVDDSALIADVEATDADPAETFVPEGSDDGGDADVLADGGPETEDDVSAPCPCGPTMHCIEGGGCADDVCLKGQLTCDSLAALKVCNNDGSAFEVEACPGESLCYLGQCTEPVCDPAEPPFCGETGVLTKCNSLGLDYIELPCPGGTACFGGLCTPIQPNVIVVVDTSGSMSLLFDDDTTYPDECQGEEGCPPWTWPGCDDPDEPLTRLGRAKKALQALMTSDAATTVRLALQRFPEVGRKYPGCKTGYSQFKFKMSGDVDKQAVDLAWFEPNLSQIMAVPFSPDTGDNDTAALLSWVDFTEEVGPGADCNSGLGCTSNVCYAFEGTGPQKKCQLHTDPELRGDGPTPLGKSLFYAGEYLRHFVLVEGKACAQDSDCGSPHHACQQGKCRDPFHKCRQTSVILFTDGLDTVDDDPETFFHPRVQAKRLRYGLNCTNDFECGGGAACVEGRCWVDALDTVPDKMCNALAQGCMSDGDCPDYFCGLPQPCSGKCEPAKVAVKATAGKAVLKDHDGNPLSVTTHVVDASGLGEANKLVALNGGGIHVSVDFEDIDEVVAQLLTLLDVKTDTGACTGESTD